MNDKPMPETIAAWRFRPEKADEWIYGGWSGDHDHKTTSYTRTDVAQAMVAAAYEAALSVGGMHIGFNSEGEPDGSYCTVEPHDPIGMSLWIRAERIRAISRADAKASLDRIVQEAVDEALEMARGAVLAGKLFDEISTSDYHAYNTAIDHAAKAITALKGTEE